MSSGPPSLLRRLLSWLLPRGPAREGLVGDLDELYSGRLRRGKTVADLWYAEQVVFVALHYLPRRCMATWKRGRTWLDGFSLDLKLGGRMLVKYPGLSIVGGLAMAFAICAGSLIFEIVSLFA